MSIPIINKESVEFATSKLRKLYNKGIIVPEKKTYLADLKNSSGPYLAIQNEDDEPTYIQDAASQIASLGLGFNPTSFFGVNHFLEAHTNDTTGEEFTKLLASYHSFLKRKLDVNKLSIEFTNSGAEAIETALGLAYNRCSNPKRRKVLAFEGSFHGRMLVSLASTWNKSKREPFVFLSFETLFLDIPFLGDDNIHREIPRNFIQNYENIHLKSKSKKSYNSNDQEQLDLEIKSLNKIHESLLSDEIFAILIEPMQCEGGDRYLSSRFMNALLTLSKSFNIPLIFDEVQTGFHLGCSFFWHKSFNLKNAIGDMIFPDYVVCAKKSQSGMVLDLNNTTEDLIIEEVNTASIIRGYYHALSLDQSRTRIENLEKSARLHLSKLIAQFSDYIHSPRCAGIAFAFDLNDSKEIANFIKNRFDHGLLFYPAGSHTLRFRLNTSYSKNDLDFLFERLTQLCKSIFCNDTPVIPDTFPKQIKKTQRLYEFQELLLDYKVKSFNHENICSDQALIDINKYFMKHFQYELQIITEENFNDYQNKIQNLQEEVYEKARQTSIENFKVCTLSGHGLAIALLCPKTKDLLGISFCSSLSDHPFERGVRRDDNYENHLSMYMLDTTVSPKVDGQGFGRDLKYSLSLILMARGYHSISGRNRDQMASSMLSINSSLGAYKSQYITEDYPDFEEHRDVIYYTHRLLWDKSKLSLSDKITSPLKNFIPHSKDVIKTIPIMNNKICLSNFVSESFLDHLDDLSNSMPEELRHIYTTSGQSECVDKIVKSLWFNRDKTKQCATFLTFDGHFFGKGSFLSRDLSNLHKSPYFQVNRLEHPTIKNMKEVLKKIEELLISESIFSIWLEPLLQKTMAETPLEFLKELKKLSIKYEVPVVYNESASSNFRYDSTVEFCSQLKDIAPSATMSYLGAQAGICFLTKKYFIDAPLMVISTWDGDELSFEHYINARKMFKNQGTYNTLVTDFEKALKELLSMFNIDDLCLKNARGSFSGHIPIWMQSYFKFTNQKYIINPSYFSMVAFCNQVKEIIKELKDQK